MESSAKLPFFLCFLIMVLRAELAWSEGNNLDTKLESHVGVILDMDSLGGKVCYSSLSMAVSDFYASHSHYRTRLVLHPRDSKMDIVTAALAAIDLLQNVEVQAIIGPQMSSQVEFIMDLGEKAQIPIISFSATSPSLRSRTEYFVQTTPPDDTQVKAIASIVQAFGWRKVILIHEDTDYGNQLTPYLVQALQEMNSGVPYRSVISPTATDEEIMNELLRLKTMQISIFVVHMLMPLGSRLFLKAKEAALMSEGYAWIITSGLTSYFEFMDSSTIDSMQGVLAVTPYIPQSMELNNFIRRWREQFFKENPGIERANMINFGIWAYDTVWALAMAVEKVEELNPQMLKLKFEQNSNDILRLGVSQIGHKLLDEILKIEFKGLSGDFHLVNGQLQPSAIQILNVIGNGKQEISFWTSARGILRNLDAVSGDLNMDFKNSHPTSKNSLGGIIWPGESTTEPKGWVIPVNGTKLRIGVPVCDSSGVFVKVEQDPLTNSTVVSGYCIEVFISALKSLPYDIPYEFIPFHKDDNQSADYYNDLIYQVYLKNYDAVVGDTTIIANRSAYVDFTLPYTDGGVWMIVPTKQGQSKKIWTFFVPLIPYLWLFNGAFLVFTIFAIWILQHRRNKIFQDRTREKLGRIFSKLLTLVWLSVVFIFTMNSRNSTESLTSKLTANQLQPTTTDFEDLIKNDDYVGYRKGSFVVEFLRRSNFQESRLKALNTPDECENALLKGSLDGGITAFFDELPYINVFLAKYCSKYTVVGPTHRSDGFGFVFPRGSPLVADISKAVLSVTEGKKMSEIESAWLQNRTSCDDQNRYIILKPVFVTGIISILSLIFFSVMPSHKQGKLKPKQGKLKPKRAT